MNCEVDCTGARKSIRKELSAWGRNVLVLTGLETIGEELVSKNIWNEVCPDSALCLSQSTEEDFDHSSYSCTTCYLRSTHLVNMREEPTSSRSRTAHSPGVDVLRSLAADSIENVTGAQDSMSQMMNNTAYQQAVQFDLMSQMHLLCLMNMGPAAPNLPMSAEMQRLVMDNQLPFASQFLSQQQQMVWQHMMLSQMQRSPQLQREQPSRSKEIEIFPCVQSLKKRDEIPLDLSKKADDIVKEGVSASNEKKTEDPICTITSENQNNCSLKRNYTQLDLSAAVNDIRNGKLGTRRASVVYGIPRSTLRNKIYKLEAAEEMTGNPIIFKRRRPGGQSSEEKKLADEVEREKISTSSKSRSCSISPDSDDSTEGTNDSFGHEEKTHNLNDMPAAFGMSQKGPWSNALWANIFSGQTSMTPDIMACAKKGESKKEENGDWKRSRPKRGQYRKYDKNALDEAVQSVRRGEMSVHRAGSYYGVPHSTLEYKVKERNLMRKRKVEDGERVAKEELKSSSPDVEMNHLEQVVVV